MVDCCGWVVFVVVVVVVVVVVYRYWFSPEMDFLNNAMDHAQRHVTGSTDIVLHKGNVINVGRSSPLSLYNEDLVSMDKEGGFDATLSTGFIKTLSTRLKANKARDALPGAPESWATPKTE